MGNFKTVSEKPICNSGKSKAHKRDSWRIFNFFLRQTSSLTGTLPNFETVDSHAVTLHFPKFFPSVPIEASLAHPVFHPNVHPETGFVCLWNRFSPGDTVMEAISQLQQVITWKLVNQETDHLMQPEALAWYKDPARKWNSPSPTSRSSSQPTSNRSALTPSVRPTPTANASNSLQNLWKTRP